MAHRDHLASHFNYSAKLAVPFRFYLFSFPLALNSGLVMECGEMDENLIEEIITSLDPDLVPWIYIDLAFITGLDGVEREVHGKELSVLLNHPSLEKIALSVQVLMDRKRLKEDITTAISDFWVDALDQGTDSNDFNY